MNKLHPYYHNCEAVNSNVVFVGDHGEHHVNVREIIKTHRTGEPKELPPVYFDPNEPGVSP